MITSLRRGLAPALVWVQGTTPYRLVAHAWKPAIVIREASGKDLERRISELYGDETGKETPSDPSVVNYVVQSGGMTVGFGQLVFHRDENPCFRGFWIHSVYIRPRYRRMGLGKELTRALILHAKRQGAKEVFIQVFENNRSAVRMYEQEGFRYFPVCSREMQQHLDRLFQQTGKRALIMYLPLGPTSGESGRGNGPCDGRTLSDQTGE